MLKKRLISFVPALILAALVATPGSAGARPPGGPQEVRSPISKLDQALLAHTSLEPKLRGQRIMEGANVSFRDGRAVYTKASESRPAAAQELTPGVTQDGKCNGPTYEIGDVRLLWVHDYNTMQDEQRPFTLQAITPHVYMWADPTAGATPEELEAGAQRFEKIYNVDRRYFGEPGRCNLLPYRQPPRMQQIWGEPWYDADDNIHINIANFNIQVGATVVAGYYSSADEYPNEVNQHSNEGEWFYMNSTLFNPTTDSYTSILAHEFYHMIQFPNDANEDTWVNEGMADVAIEVNGYFTLTGSHTSDYAVNSDDQLTHWDGALYDYGNAYSYLSYLLEHYGPPDDPSTGVKENYALAEAITKTDADGIEGLSEVLRTNPYKSQLASHYRNQDANGVFLDRGIANIINDTTIKQGQAGYYTLGDLRVQPQGEFNDGYPRTETGSTDVYGYRTYIFNSGADGSFDVTADPQVQVVPNQEGMPSPTHFLWGNRVDETETFAEREADLTSATNPHLKFSYWYLIELDFDYAYLQISEDDGETWTNLACCESNDNDPNGNNQGNGITGQSDGTYPDNPLAGPEWIAEDVDLSAYAGKVVRIRFQYDTDPAVNEPGFTVDNLELVDGEDQIWPLATFESGLDGFEVYGTGSSTFLSIESDSDNQLVLQLLKLGGSRISVKRLRGQEAADAVVAGGAMDAERTIAIYSSLTPITSEQYGYTWTAEASPLPDLVAPVLEDPGETHPVNTRFMLNWTEASNAGTRAPNVYEIQGTNLLTEHFFDNAESGMDNWETSTEGAGAVAWHNDNRKSHSGEFSFQASASEGAVDTSALMTYKDPITLPARGTTNLSFFGWAINESDDAVAVEVLPEGEDVWQPIYQSARSELAPDAAVAFAEEPMFPTSVDLAAYAGQTVQLRFRFTAGSANRAGSTPFGWYVDDIQLQSSDWFTIKKVPGPTSAPMKHGNPGHYFFRVRAEYTRFFSGPWSNVVDLELVPKS